MRESGTSYVSRTCRIDRKSTRLNSSHLVISYAVFCLKKKKHAQAATRVPPLPARLRLQSSNYDSHQLHPIKSSSRLYLTSCRPMASARAPVSSRVLSD